MHTFNSFTLLCTWNQHNIPNQLNSNKLKKAIKQVKITQITYITGELLSRGTNAKQQTSPGNHKKRSTSTRAALQVLTALSVYLTFSLQANSCCSMNSDPNICASVWMFWCDPLCGAWRNAKA